MKKYFISTRFSKDYETGGHTPDKRGNIFLVIWEIIKPRICNPIIKIRCEYSVNKTIKQKILLSRLVMSLGLRLKLFKNRIELFRRKLEYKLKERKIRKIIKDFQYNNK